MIDLSALNTLGVPARAQTAYWVRSLTDLESLAPKLRDSACVILGGGSNVVLPANVERPVCLIRNLGIRTTTEGDRVMVTVAAGEGWHNLVRWSLGQGLSGIENLVLIPGSVGAAPVQNIGAYGVELADRLVSLRALEIETGRILSLNAAECAFGYRTSLFKTTPGRFVIAEVTLSLDTRPGRVQTDYSDVGEELARMGRAEVRPVDVAEAVTRVRRRKLPDPRQVPNAGSFFKNPVVSRDEHDRLAAALPDLKSYPDPGGVKLAAAQLIEHCMKLGTDKRPPWASRSAPVRVWPRQPLVLTNPGRRPAVEVLAAAEQIRAAVLERFGIRLELEPDAL